MRLPPPPPPSPPARGPLGHQPQYAADPLGSVRQWTAAHGPVILLRFGPTRALLFTTPQAVEDILVNDADSFRKAPVVRRLARRVIGGSIFTSEGEAWRRQREVLKVPFSRSHIEAHSAVIGEEMKAMVGRWIERRKVPILAETMRLSQRIAGRVLFGGDVSDEDVERVAGALEVTSADFQHGVDHPLSLAIPDWMPTRRRAKLRRALATLDDVVGRMVENRRADMAHGSDVLGELLRLQPTTPWLTDRLLRDNLVTLLVESREDPALLLTWSLALLAHDSSGVADRVAAEVHQVFGDAVPTVADLRRLPLTVAILHEALRLYPLVYGTGREAVRDCVIDATPVKRGTVVLIGQDAMNRDPARYHDADAFQPDRWLERPPETLPAGAFTPFNIGPRRCLGEPLAWTIGIIGLAMLARDLHFQASESELVEPVIRLSLRPSHEIWLTVRRRSSGADAVPQPVGGA
jgi:cytochrome P450